MLSISPASERDDVIRTIDSLPVDYDGIDLVIYSEDTKKVKQIIKEGDLESTLLNGQMEVLFCEEPYSSDDTYMNIGLEDCRTDLITFLRPGDTVEFFDPDLLYEKFDVGFGNIEGGYPVASVCYESRMLPISVDGIIFSVKYLRENWLKLGDSFIPCLINTLVSDLEKADYGDSWGRYSIDELYSVSPGRRDTLEVEQRLPQIYVDLWKDHKVGYNYYLRDLIWTRISRAAGIVIASYPEKKSIVSEFYKYLLPENKVNILC